MTEDLKGTANRRDFLTKVGLAGVGATVLAGAGATSRYMFPTVFYEPAKRVKIGRPSDYSIGTTTFLADKKIFLLRSDEGICAISATCTHLGCVVAEQEEGFSCPCHGSVFNANGEVVRGPAPRGLPWFAVSLSPGGQLVVDRGRTVEPGTTLAV